jgi:predicted membrane protein (TIGR00267 family)
MLQRLRFLIRLTHAHRIARRYFVTNGFDGALTMLGITIGFHASGITDLRAMLGTGLGAAIALAVSGVASAYVSETAERDRELQDLEQSLARDLEQSVHGLAAGLVPWLVAATNGLAPLFIALLVLAPIWLAWSGVSLPVPPLHAAVAMAFVCVFFLGAFLGSISGRFWLWSALRTVLIAAATAGIIVLVNSALA